MQSLGMSSIFVLAKTLVRPSSKCLFSLHKIICLGSKNTRNNFINCENKITGDETEASYSPSSKFVQTAMQLCLHSEKRCTGNIHRQRIFNSEPAYRIDRLLKSITNTFLGFRIQTNTRYCIHSQNRTTYLLSFPHFWDHSDGQILGLHLLARTRTTDLPTSPHFWM